MFVSVSQREVRLGGRMWESKFVSGPQWFVVKLQMVQLQWQFPLYPVISTPLYIFWLYSPAALSSSTKDLCRRHLGDINKRCLILIVCLLYDSEAVDIDTNLQQVSPNFNCCYIFFTFRMFIAEEFIDSFEILNCKCLICALMAHRHIIKKLENFNWTVHLEIKVTSLLVISEYRNIVLLKLRKTQTI